MTASGIKNNQYLHIHINDENLVIIAREILIVKIISSPEFDPSKDSDINYVWHLWYDATWPEATLKRFIKDTKDLLNQSLPYNIFIPESSIHLGRLRDVWTKWLSIVQTISVSEVLADRYNIFYQIKSLQHIFKFIFKFPTKGPALL